MSNDSQEMVIGGVVRPAPQRRRPQVAKVKRIEGCRRIVVAPDEDVAGFRLRLKDLFATSSPLFVEASLKQLLYATRLPGEDVGCTTSVSAALELIAALEPANEVEASLSIHIACLHAASLNVLGRMHSVGERNVIAYSTAAAKLEGAYQRSIESYRRLKYGQTQVVRIERVNIEAGAQAVIGLTR
jgi:hypothetical protein